MATTTLHYQSDLVGSIATHLRDLTGYSTLAHELIQNADDARGATWISFDAKKDALIVRNDGIFSSCGDPAAPNCVEEDDSTGRCDLHSFRKYAGQAKRERDGATGAFGIGFTVVYQLTDRPEMISNGEHWTLAPEDGAVERCDGCAHCRGTSGTNSPLPWATPASSLRRALRAEPLQRGV